MNEYSCTFDNRNPLMGEDTKKKKKEPHLSNYVKKLRFFKSKYISAIQNEY